MTITPDQFKAARLRAGLSLRKCAAALHRSARLISYWEAPASQRPIDPACYELLLRIGQETQDAADGPRRSN